MVMIICLSCMAIGSSSTTGQNGAHHREEIPELNELVAIAAEQGAVFQVFGVNYDGLQGDDLTGVMERMQIEFPVLQMIPVSR